MASFSSGWKPKNLFSRSPSTDSRKSYSANPGVPVEQSEDTATIIAWKTAINTFRKSLTDKEFNSVTTPITPQDVVHEVERWQLQQSNSRHAKVCAAVRNGLVRMDRFTGAIDVLAQGTPAPGCLLWGGIKVALTVNI